MAGIDIGNQFPNSRMASAVKRGLSRFVSVDTPTTEVGEQNAVNIAAVQTLTIPATALYATVQAQGGPAYYTLDGTVPSAVNGQVLAQNAVLPLYGASLAALKIIGTTMSVIYYR